MNFLYELLEINENMATRFLKLKNLETGKLEECFDDSAVVGEQNFDFMEKNHRYNCKIKLFGKVVDEKTDNSTLCRIINEEVHVGTRQMVEVAMGVGHYYIPKNRINNPRRNESFYFLCVRKDLIQVDDVVHADYL